MEGNARVRGLKGESKGLGEKRYNMKGIAGLLSVV